MPGISNLPEVGIRSSLDRAHDQSFQRVEEYNHGSWESVTGVVSLFPPTSHTRVKNLSM